MNARQETEHAAPPVIGAPSADGWRSVATAVHSGRQIAVPLLITVTMTNYEPLWIDLGENLYYWDHPVTAMPVFPEGVIVYSTPIGPEPVSFTPMWKSTEPLLWQMCRVAFGASRAPWMRPGGRYKLLRWPNLTEIQHTPADLRMIAALSHGFFSAEELASVTGSTAEDAQSLLNVLSLLGVLDAAGGPLLPPPINAAAATQAEPAKRFGLFGKLRARLGGTRG